MSDYTFRGDPSMIFPFAAIDEDAIGDGGSTARPVDTWLISRQVGNNMAIAGDNASIYVPVLGGRSQVAGEHYGFRPAGAIASWVRIHGADLIVGRGCTGITVNLLGAVVGFNDNTEGVDFRVDFGNQSTIYTAANTSGYAEEYGNFAIAVNLETPTTKIESIPFSVWVRSYDDGENTAKGSLDVEPRGPAFAPASSADASFFDESSTSSPDADSLDVQFVQITDGSDPDGVNFDMLCNQFSTGAYGAAVNPPEGFDGYTLTFRYMTVFLEKSASVTPHYSRDSIAAVEQGAISAIDPAGDRKVSGAESVARVALGLAQLYQRPIVHMIGPRGYLNAADEPYSGKDYPIIWPYVRGNDGEKTLITEQFTPKTTDPRVAIFAQFIGVHLRQPNSKSGATARGLVGKASWDLKIICDQLDTVSGLANWATDTIEYGSATDTVPFSLYPAFSSGQYPFLRFAHFTESWDPAYQQNFAHFEGRLFPDDLNIVERFSSVTMIDGFQGAAINRFPLRVRLTAELNTGEEIVYVTNQNATPQFLRLYCVGFSIVEIPNAD